MNFSSMEINNYWPWIGIGLLFFLGLGIFYWVQAGKKKIKQKSDTVLPAAPKVQERPVAEPQKSLATGPEAVPSPPEKELKADAAIEVEVRAEAEAETKVTTQPSPIEERPKIPWIKRLQKGLSRSREEIWGKLEKIVSGTDTALTEAALEELEEVLYAADMGPTMVADLMKELGQKIRKNFTINDLKAFLYEYLETKMGPIQHQVDTNLYHFDASSSPTNTGSTGKTKVIMVIGVNGAGKTTTIGKLATKLTRQGAKVVVGACDTFRAAAVDQLEVWCKRAGAEMIRAKEGSDPSGVAFEAAKLAKESGADYCILDTAGRIHTKTNLMEELKKGKRVLSKVDEAYPHQVLLVLDAVTGQNALNQAREFHKALGVTGLVFTKCDGSSKAGNAVSIVQNLNIPIVYIGVGEEVEDLNIFDLQEYLKVLLDFQT